MASFNTCQRWFKPVTVSADGQVKHRMGTDWDSESSPLV